MVPGFFGWGRVGMVGVLSGGVVGSVTVHWMAVIASN